MSTFRKQRDAAPAGFFEVEAAGLAWLAAAGAVPVVGVRGVGAGWIELDRLTPGSPTTPAHADALGAGLAALHDAGAPAFGAPPAGWSGDGFIGDAPLPLRTEDAWGTFYARHRIAPYLAGAGLTSRQRGTVERLCAALESGAFDDDAPPARVHGDLWSGNVVWTDAGATLIDPAAHGGHRITDLAMLALFGLPHLRRVEDAYAAASTHLPDGWRDLVGLHQVHPLLVHAVLFGGGYGARAADAAASALAQIG